MWAIWPICWTTTWTTPEFRGSFVNLEEHRQDTYLLRRTGTMVNAIVTTTRSPVQQYARQQPETLFTLLEGFRLADTLRLTVSEARPVNRSGQPLFMSQVFPSFRLQVDPEGTWTARVWTWGYLAYTVEVTWTTAEPPLSGLDPAPPDGADRCTRHPVVQSALWAALATA